MNVIISETTRFIGIVQQNKNSVIINLHAVSNRQSQSSFIFLLYGKKDALHVIKSLTSLFAFHRREKVLLVWM